MARPTDAEIRMMIETAAETTAHWTGNSYADGVEAALYWVLGEGTAPDEEN